MRDLGHAQKRQKWQKRAVQREMAEHAMQVQQFTCFSTAALPVLRKQP